MKKTTCRNLRGACDAVITGETAEEMGQKCRDHVGEMLKAGDQAHVDQVESMKALSQEDQIAWYKGFLESFDSLENA